MTDPWHDRLLVGDALEQLRTVPDALVRTCVTSPPYFGKRRYQDRPDPLEIGREASPAEYVARLVAVFHEVRRVLRPDGTLWLNLGDAIRDGRLLGLPWRVALALVDDGWRLVADLIWHKPNAMPSPATNRPTTDHEYLFLLAAGPRHYYDADAIREPHVTFTAASRMRGGRRHFGLRHGTPERGKFAGAVNLHDGRWDQAFHPLGRNKRTVWSVPLSKNRDAHFAVFPEALVEPCLLAGSAPGDLVLDPFLGSGVTALVARRLSRPWLGCELSPSYATLITRRLGENPRSDSTNRR
jgi:site-specific DNA-methyltransferase (adenine-specific)